MSFFKEKDDLFTKHFQNLCNEDSDSDDEDHKYDDNKSIDDSIEIKTKLERGDLTTIDEIQYNSDEESPSKKLKTENGFSPKWIPSPTLKEQKSPKSNDVDLFAQNKQTVLISDNRANESIECFLIDDCDRIEGNNNTNNNLSEQLPLALRKGRRKCATKKNDLSQVITLSSDEEDNNNNPNITIPIAQQLSNENTSSSQPQQQVNNTTINNSQDNDNYRFNLKITVAGTYKQFTTTYKTKLSDALKDLLDQLRLESKGLIIKSPLGQTIPLGESPYSLELTPGVILEAIEISLNDTNQDNNNVISSDQIRLKIQDGNRKNTKEFLISKNQPLLHLKEMYAKEINIPSIDKIVFSFDGDEIDDESTPEEVEIEDDCVIDVRFTN